jgi:hypothetical protein
MYVSVCLFVRPIRNSQLIEKLGVWCKKTGPPRCSPILAFFYNQKAVPGSRREKVWIHLRQGKCENPGLHTVPLSIALKIEFRLSVVSIMMLIGGCN